MNDNMQNLVSCLIFFLMFRGIKGDSVNNGEQGMASRPQTFWSEYNFGENADDPVITDEYEPDDDEDFDANRLGKSSLENLKLYKEIVASEKKKNDSSEMKLQRRARNKQSAPIECLYCFGTNDRNNISSGSENCYKGINISSVDCGHETKQCFIEFNPVFIKRGCYEPKKLNVTFYCKCTLCNDKPADMRKFYVYDNIKDWAFDNRRLQMPRLPGVTAACKYCNTSDTGYVQTCLDGTNVEYKICNEGQVCFTHIDKYKGTIIRGCANKPAYNSFFYFCNGTNCNYNNYWDSDVSFLIHGNRTRLVSFIETESSTTMLKINTILLCVSLIFNMHDM